MNYGVTTIKEKKELDKLLQSIIKRPLHTCEIVQLKELRAVAQVAGGYLKELV